MIKTSRKKLNKSIESWRVYVRVKGLRSLMVIILIVYALIEGKLHFNKSGTALLVKHFSQDLKAN